MEQKVLRSRDPFPPEACNERKSLKTWLLQGSWARFHSPWCRAWHEYCWWCNDLSIGKTDFFFPSVPYGTLWDLRQCKPSLKSFCFAWKKIKIKPTKNGHARFQYAKKILLKTSIQQKPFFDTTAQYTKSCSLTHTQTHMHTQTHTYVYTLTHTNLF